MSSNHTPGSGHTIHRHRHHHGWDNSFAPVLTIAPGETVEFETVDSSGGQLGPDSTLADLARMDFGKVNPVTDTLQNVRDVLTVRLNGWLGKYR